MAATVNAIQAHLTGSSDAVRSQTPPSTHASYFVYLLALQYVFLVGGFSASNWMFEEIRRRLDDAAIKCQVKRGDDDT